ncbi:zinc-binding dehydrogenase [Paenibacillus amylolyticus]|nr:zinc-binding dehydrogenase [Paenibacillus amylolyticus]WFR60974.1 zinc-binding dehydrogenase [Paenibacillus amylolyticus]
MGADRIINYKQENFEQLLEGYDAVLDTLGGDVLRKSFQVLKPGAKSCRYPGSPMPNSAKKQAWVGLKGYFYRWSVES